MIYLLDDFENVELIYVSFLSKAYNAKNKNNFKKLIFILINYI